MAPSLQNDASKRVTRLAPSPTGALHLGNIRTFLINWAMARQRGWRVLLRIEDLDTPRTKAGADWALFKLLAWLGMDWDEGPVWQSADRRPYEQAMQALAGLSPACFDDPAWWSAGGGGGYPCELSRKDVLVAASAPHGSEGEVVYPASLRPELMVRSFENTETNWRLAVPNVEVRFDDRVLGPKLVRPAQSIGDFVVWTKAGQPAYQLAVVVDDARQGVTDVVRGSDLLDSTARQILLYRALQLGQFPDYWHLPLVVGPDGRRLAKRHGDTRVTHYRELGVPAEAVVGLIASWSIPELAGRPEPMNADAFVERFDLATMPVEQIVFSQEDDAWLRSQAT